MEEQCFAYSIKDINLKEINKSILNNIIFNTWNFERLFNSVISLCF